MCKISINTANSDEAVVELDCDGVVTRKVGAARTLKSQTVLPLIESMLLAHNLQPADITSITLFTGPGSYTGLRVGAAIAQALAFILDISVNGSAKGTPIDLIYA